MVKRKNEQIEESNGAEEQAAPKAKPAPKKPSDPLISVGEFVQELTGADWQLGRAFITHLRVQRRAGKSVRHKGTTNEWMSDFREWCRTPVQ
jgi:hypothetical protein